MTQPDDFASALADAVTSALSYRTTIVSPERAIESLLATPEMQAIRAALFTCGGPTWGGDRAGKLRLLGLPESVIEWVLQLRARNDELMADIAAAYCRVDDMEATDGNG